ncbi:hypothetical protein GCM10007301_56030 [Azorhizobium oxalatiphilum]|uniref:Uncharacterized protein n=1 Tax=Azorhizobium oxalatiphilum TaxID=980631 RepID=A0A917CJZ8_9HYPH|nr:hypothetical protein [Azorhizobium oxalatiphilum]GGF88867.1 hypothetical protein GCM10007301_56030 [Azorhizobium oxalatiphilum]
MRSILLAAAAFTLAGVGAASAQTLSPEQAKAFVVGRSFAFTCFEGTRGAGRIFADGSVAGTLTMRSQGIARYVRLPPNTVRVREENVCGYIEGMTFEPCFTVIKTSPTTFRGTLAGVDTMWCEFVREGGSDRPRVASRRKQHKEESSSAVTAESAAE